MCVNGSENSSSLCLLSVQFGLEVKYVRRVIEDNIMEVGVIINPKYEQLSNVNYKRFTSHNVPCTDFNVTYNEQTGLLTYTFVYNRTI